MAGPESNVAIERRPDSGRARPTARVRHARACWAEKLRASIGARLVGEADVLAHLAEATGARLRIDAMPIDVRNQPDQSRYAVFLDDELAGFAAYQERGSEIVLTHTEIDSRFEGKGIESELARGVLDDIRSRDLAALPYCAFMNGYIKRHAEYAELVPDDRRAEFGL